MKTKQHTLTPQEAFIVHARSLKGTHPDATWEEIATRIIALNPLGCLAVITDIGTWPSSEPELQALQKVWK